MDGVNVGLELLLGGCFASENTNVGLFLFCSRLLGFVKKGHFVAYEILPPLKNGNLSA